MQFSNIQITAVAIVISAITLTVYSPRISTRDTVPAPQESLLDDLDKETYSNTTGKIWGVKREE